MVLLAGLDQIDAVFTDFVSAVEAIIRNSKECKAQQISRGGSTDTEQWRFDIKQLKCYWQ
jgi:hypothetical protein